MFPFSLYRIYILNVKHNKIKILFLNFHHKYSKEFEKKKYLNVWDFLCGIPGVGYCQWYVWIKQISKIELTHLHYRNESTIIIITAFNTVLKCTKWEKKKTYIVYIFLWSVLCQAIQFFRLLGQSPSITIADQYIYEKIKTSHIKLVFVFNSYYWITHSNSHIHVYNINSSIFSVCV